MARRVGSSNEARRRLTLERKPLPAIRELDTRVPALPAGLGNAIMEAFRLPPSRRIGELRKLCEDAIDRGDLEARQDVGYYLAYLVKQGLPAGV